MASTLILYSSTTKNISIRYIDTIISGSPISKTVGRYQRILRGYNICDFQINLKSIGFFYQENKL